jgi:alanine racemase
MRDDVLHLAAGGRLTVDLKAIGDNYRALAAKAPASIVGAVIKADAYGLGAERVGSALAAAGCRDFFVAHLSEALSVRDALPDGARLYVLNGLQPGAEGACAAAGVIPVINSLEQARRWAWSGGDGRPAALQIDSGMARLGLSGPDVVALATDRALLDRLSIQLIMSHLACADEPGRPANRAQAERFRQLAAHLPPAPLSLANSGGVGLGEAFHMDLVRLGVSLYGVDAAPGAAPSMTPVVRLNARVIQVRSVGAGDGVGYGLDYARATPGDIATIGVGYADGWPRSLGGRGKAYYGGIALPIAGRVSMDSITLDVTALSERGIRLELGDEVELLGPHQDLAAVAADAGTIPYEILTGLGRRFHRSYAEGCAVMKSARLRRAS